MPWKTEHPGHRRRSEIRFGRSSVFGFLKPFPFFDLHATRSESHATGFGTGSVSVVRHMGHRKSVWILRLSDAMATSPWESESPGRRFESFQAHQFYRIPVVIAVGSRDRNPLVCHMACAQIATDRAASADVTGNGPLQGRHHHNSIAQPAPM